MNIGLLLPHSQLRPALTQQLFKGIEEAFEKADRPYEFLYENIGHGSDKKECLQAAQNLFLYKNVDTLFAMTGHQILEPLIELGKQYGKDVVILDMGARPWTYSSMLALEHQHFYSFGIWESAWQLGQHAASELGKRTLVSSSLFNSGYPLTWSYEQGLASAGGEIVGYQLQRDDHVEPNWKEVFEAAKSNEADVILALHEKDTLLRMFEERRNLNMEHIHIASLSILLEEAHELQKDLPMKNIHLAGPPPVSLENGDSNQVRQWAYESTSQYLEDRSGGISPLQDPGKFSVSSFLVNGSQVCKTKTDSMPAETFQELLKPDLQPPESGWTNPYLFT